ncbi:hypothetical protein STFR1_50369 [Bacillus vallismortis]
MVNNKINILDKNETIKRSEDLSLSGLEIMKPWLK